MPNLMTKKNESRMEKMFKLHSEGKSFSQIGKKYGVSRQRVHQIVSRHPEKVKK